MPEHRNFPFNTLHKFIFDTGLVSELPANPEGVGDVYFSSDDTSINVADGAGTAWDSFDISSLAASYLSVIAGPYNVPSGVATLSITDIPQTHYELDIVFQLRTNYSGGVADYSLLTINGDTTANYLQLGIGNPVGVTSFTTTNSNSSNYVSLSETAQSNQQPANSHGYLRVAIKNYANNSDYKVGFYHAGKNSGTLANHQTQSYGAFLWKSTNAITQIDITPLNGTQIMANSTFIVYGYGTAI